jgi:type I restriction enzyme S subunit
MKAKTKTLTPKLRFPEFRDGPVWKEKRFADLYAFKPTNTLSRDKLNYEGGTIRNIHYGDIHTRFQTLFDIKRELVPFVTNGLADDFVDDAFCTEGDLVFADASEDLNDVGKSIEIVALHGERVLSGTHTILATRRDAQLTIGFSGYLFRSERMREQIKKEAQGSKVYGISSGRLANVNVCFPTKEDEQRKIAACLTSLDEWIAAERRKLEALRDYKIGLMQQLFPREGETRPRLRFPEFRNAPDWEAKVGGDVFTNRKDDGEEGLPIYSVTMNEGMVPRASLDRDFYDIEDPTGNKKACKGDIAYNMMRMWQGAQGVAVEDCMVSPAYVVLTPLKDVSSEFFAFLFKLPQSLQLLTSHSRGLTKDRLRLYFDDFERVPLRVPQFPEQQRIAACLSSLDALIAAQSRKLDGLRAHKNGLMQHLFPSADGV